VAPVVLLGVLALAAVALFIWQPWAAPAPAAPQPTQAPEPTTATQAQGEPAPTPGELPPPEPPQCFMAGQEWFSPVDEMPMVCVPGGEFAMGSAAGDPFAFSDEIPLHPVYLDGFWIDKFEVTFGRYRKCVEAGDCTPPDAIAPGEDYPVFNVTWDQAAAYCSWAGRRLPKEAEWEKAARGSDGRPYPWGPMPAGTNRANFGKRIGTVLPVGRLVEGASPFGAQDMAGNVWEWTSSLFRPYPFDPEDGREDQDSQEPRSIRGGSWQVPEGLIRTAARERMLRFNSELDQGFRCAW
jgi:formylglycine-generating enzyme required for sulfatase activity